MCGCKKNSRLENFLRNLEGFFEYIGGSQGGSNIRYDEVYSSLLTSLYQLDDDGNKVVVDWDTDANGFIIDVSKPVYVGSLRDNSDSNFVTTESQGIGNSYNDIVKYGFKPTVGEFPDKDVALRSFIIDADEDSVLPISYNNYDIECKFRGIVKALCLPKVNFYIYPFENMGDLFHQNTSLPQFGGHFGIERNSYGKIGNFTYHLEFENTEAIDLKSNIIQRAKVSVLMLPIHDDNISKFKLHGHRDGKYNSSFNVPLGEYSFDSSVDYGEEVNARGVCDIVHVNFVNADSNYADLVPTDSCQFLSALVSKGHYGGEELPFGYKWGSGLNDIFVDVTGSISANMSKLGRYESRKISSYMRSCFNIAYNTKHIDNTKDMYLYNLDTNYKLDIKEIGDSITIPVKRLPVLDLSGILNINDFDSTEEYIYVSDTTGMAGYYLTKYSEFSNDIHLQVASSNTNPTSLDIERHLYIFCSSDAPAPVDDSGLCIGNHSNSRIVYDITCKPTKMNEEVQYTLKKMG